MKNKSRFTLVTVALICILIMLVGCSQNNEPENLDSTLSSLPAVTPEYISEWPENEFTEVIPKPEYGTMDYICNYSENGRYMLVLKEITKAESDMYVDKLKEYGYTEIHSNGNQVSVGTMLEKDNIILSVAYSDDIFNILITIENNT